MLNKKNKIIASFTLGYLLCLVNERLCGEGIQSSMTDKIFVLYKQEIISAIQNLHYELFGEIIEIEKDPQISSEFFSITKTIYESIQDKNHWGDDSFLETAFLSGSFLCVIESFDGERFDLQVFEQILSELLNQINVTIDHHQFSSTVTNIRSKDLSDRICSRDEIFYMISGRNPNHTEIRHIQYYIDNPSALHAVCIA